MGRLATHGLDTARGRPAAGLAISLYRLAGDWRCAAGLAGAEPLFFDRIPIRFGLSGDGHGRVPLLFSPHDHSPFCGS